MDYSTEYCSFVGLDYIICECGDTFADENALRVHLDADHSTTVNQDKAANQTINLVDNQIIKEEIPAEERVVNKTDQPVVNKNQPVVNTKNHSEVSTKNQPEVEMQADLVDLCGLEEEQPHEEFYLESADQSGGLHFILPNGVKQEDIVLQYVQEDDQNAEDDQNEQVEQDDHSDYATKEATDKIIIERRSVPDPLASKQVTFVRHPFAKEVVILSEGNAEHDYGKEEAKPVVHDFYFCDTCGKSYASEKAVKKHYTRMHSPHGLDRKEHNKKTVVCDVCGKKYAKSKRTCEGCGNKRPTDRPRRMGPRKVNRVACEVCGVTRTSNAALRYHQRVHTGEKPYHCPMCPKAFTMPLFLQLHIRTHTGERPYKCQQCTKSFSNQAALLRHERVHTGVKPYVCPECSKAFTQSNSMKLHYQTVHLKMPAPYKSAARKLRDRQKGIEIDDESILRFQRLQNQPIDNLEASKFLFRHRFPREELIKVPQYDFVVEEVQYTEDEESS